jgi:hypothetical protein
MMMIPVQAIVFFMAIMLLPAGVHQFTVDFHGKEVQWTKTATSVWRAVELPKQDWTEYSAANAVVTERRGAKKSSTDVSKFLVLPKGPDFSRLREIQVTKPTWGTPVRIQRAEGKIVLSQKKGAFFEKPVTISWKRKSTS